MDTKKLDPHWTCSSHVIVDICIEQQVYSPNQHEVIYVKVRYSDIRSRADTAPVKPARHLKVAL